MTKAMVPLIPLPVISTPFDRIAVDVVGPLPMTERKSRFILTIMDVAIRYAGAFQLRRVDTETVLGALFEFFAYFDIPKEILSDNGSNFTSKLAEEVNRRLGVNNIKVSLYHPTDKQDA